MTSSATRASTATRRCTSGCQGEAAVRRLQAGDRRVWDTDEASDTSAAEADLAPIGALPPQVTYS